MKIKLTLLLGCLVMNATYAQIPPGQWLCFAFDAQKKSYEGLGDSLKSAMRAANATCRKKAAQAGCKTAQSYCEQGPLSLNDKRCLVTDTNGRSWTGTGPDACTVALSLCTRWQFLHNRMSQCSVKHRHAD
ncbi:hypothetical protein [Legionella yabuuchiae]|uniref:hypothetical protein n=1 Tax=Legionella yabuuchiae TaxID=376727 RepID=UPI0010550135|nr:hypothetical protein [Legionella yabuuchiae]